MTANPYMGKVLWVDLAQGTFTEETIADDTYQKFLGGIGLGARLLFREMPPKADPLGPENILGFMAGLLNGTGSLFTGRWMAVGKSPLTGTWGDSNCGGTLAFAIKQCGYDGILFRGISLRPVYLLIDPHGPQLRDASHLWGKDAVETENLLMAEHGKRKRPAIASIGQAGENLSLIAGIVNDRGRLAARSGLGAVMGSKKLKAVVLMGSHRVSSADPMKTKLLAWKCVKNIRLPLKFINAKLIALYGAIIGKLPFGFTQTGLLFSGVLSKWGTIGNFPALVEMGDTPFKNWAGTHHDQPRIHKTVDPDQLLKTEKRKYHCRGCPLGCGALVDIAATQQESHKPEYETTAGFTSMLLNQDMQLVYEINDRLNRVGMDSISAAGTIAYAMECYEKGWITKKETGGIELTWGNAPAIRKVLDQMIHRKGFGAHLTDGVKKAAESLGTQTKEAAIHAGGQEIAFHDPRLDPGMALHASVDPTPGRHTTGAQLYTDLYRLWSRIPELPASTSFYNKSTRFSPEHGRTVSAVAVSNFTQFYSSVGACYMGMLIGVDRVPIFEWVNAATGWAFTPVEYLRIGQRIQTLRQLFNIREGIDPRSQKISRRLIGEPPMDSGPNKGIQYDLEILMKAYWQEIGWDPDTGIPTRETLASLGLSDIIGSNT